MRTLAACAAFAASVFDAAALHHYQQPGGEFLEGLEDMAAGAATNLHEERAVVSPGEEAPPSPALEVDEEQARQRKNRCEHLKTPPLCDAGDKEPSYTVGLVVAAYAEDIAWLNTLEWDGNVTVYTRDRTTEKPTRFQSKLAANLAVAEISEDEVKAASTTRSYPVDFVPVANSGGEAASYLAHIIKNYRHLPDVLFFVQGHQCADYAKFNMAKALSSVRKCFPKETGYLDMNRYDGRKSSKCTEKKKVLAHPPKLNSKTQENLNTVWSSLFADEFGGFPDKVCWDPHAQFAVSRDKLIKHPLSFYKKLAQGVENKETSMEFFWRLMFDNTAVEMLDHTEETFQKMKNYVLNREHARTP